MATLILVCGPTGAGKTTYALALSKEIGAVRFSIDAWMQKLYSQDMTELDYSWMIERVNRCYEQIWEVSQQLLTLGSDVILDLGFTTKSQRQLFVERAALLSVKSAAVESELHYLDTPQKVRRSRVTKRNIEKDPEVYSFEVNDMMFDFMEPRFEIPDAGELNGGRTVKTNVGL